MAIEEDHFTTQAVCILVVLFQTSSLIRVTEIELCFGPCLCSFPPTPLMFPYMWFLSMASELEQETFEMQIQVCWWQAKPTTV